MGLLLRAFEKRATGSVLPVAPPVAASAPATLPAPAAGVQWHPDWAPEGGWQEPGNAKGWRRPAQEGRRKELFLWDQWKKGGQTPELSAPLLKSLRPVIYSQGVRAWADRVPVQTPVLEAKAVQLTLGALESYNPVKAQLNTHVTNTLKGMHRFATTRQNMTRLTEARRRLVGPYQRALSRLKDKLEREPTVLELADEMKESPANVEKLLLEMKDDLMSSGAMDDPFLDETSESRLKLQLIRYSLTPDENTVLDYLMGTGGRPKIESTGAIAKREGWSDSRVSQIKNAIMRKWKGK
jgi:hypothetical protein